MKNYLPRIADKMISQKLRVFGAINIVGPKWCGKTTSGEHFAKSAIKLQSDPNKEALIETAKLTPSVLLNGEKPRLIDEWQDAPNIWDAVRCYCDDNGGQGNFILTGSSSKKIKTMHTGTGRISTINMYPMSLYESNESTGSISLKDLFDGKEQLKDGCVSKLEISDLIFIACRGGWPYALSLKNKNDQLLIANDYFKQIYERDMFNVDNIKRNPEIMKALLKSYARNISTLAKKRTLYADAFSEYEILSMLTIDDYIDVLNRLFIIRDINGWCPSIRSKGNLRNGPKREFIDPSIAVAALGLNPTSLSLDLKTFGFIFENMCIRDLTIYSEALDGEISYYKDKYGLEADAVLHLNDGRYALIECKLGTSYFEDAAKHLLKIEKLIEEHNKKDDVIKLRKPDLKIILCGTKYGYKRPDGIYVIPLGCLKD